MTKKTRGKQSVKKDKRRGARRQERRFISQGSSNATLVLVVGGIAALLLGAGAWAYFYAKSFAEDEQLRSLPSYLIAGGAVLLGISIWFGTSSEPPIRVGAPGIAVEKGDLRRMPWWGIDKITFESGSLALVITGKDDAGVDWTFKVSTKSHAEAVAWIVKEAQDRIPRRVDIAEETIAKLPAAVESAGTKIDLEALQVVGRRDAISGKTISYEPDARVCSQCERVYLRQSVPKKCKCGSSLAHLRPKDAEDSAETDDDGDAGEEAPSSRNMERAEESAES